VPLRAGTRNVQANGTAKSGIAATIKTKNFAFIVNNFPAKFLVRSCYMFIMVIRLMHIGLNFL